MTGKGPRQERETIINFNEAKPNAHIWTASEIIYRKLKKAGFYPYDEGERHAAFHVPRSTIRIPKQPSPARAEAGRRMAEARKAQLLKASHD
jgi:hypothetical protein